MRDGLRSRARNKESVEGKGKKDDGVVLSNVTNKIELKSNSCEELGLNGSLDAILVSEVVVEEETIVRKAAAVGDKDGVSVIVGSVYSNGEKVGGVNANNCNGELVDGVVSHNCNGGKVDSVRADYCNGERADDDRSSKSNGEQADNVQTKGRRGRKRKNPQVSSNAQMTEMIDLNEMPVVQLSRRVLRSRTVAVAANDLVKGGLNDVDEEENERNDEVDKKNMKLANVEDKSAEPSRRGKKKTKGRRGRPPKHNVENVDDAVIIGKKEKVLGSKVRLKSATSLSKLKGESAGSEKKDIRNQIIDMIVQCGWKIQFVPRASRDYNDPVYVNPEGKTHWSVTKAYKDLQERIDSGEANGVERAGFSVIPDETLSKLFRITSKKRSDFGIKRSEGVEQKEPSRNRSSSKKTVHIEQKEPSRNRSSSKKTGHTTRREKSNIGPKSCGRKRTSVPLEGRKKRRFALLARGSGNKSDPDDDDNELYNKKRSLLSWMIDLGNVPEGENVQYRDPLTGATLLEGKITYDGFSCNCCNEIHTIVGFQLHGGCKLGEPLKNIYLGSGLSLFQCLVDSWSQQVELSKIGFCSVDVAGVDYNDDTCNMCGDGGNLMCCDCCPSTFHLSCLDIENVPDGDWHCMYCTCKFCELVGDETLSQDDGHHLITCQLCEEKFHSTCTDQTDAESMNSAIASFCGAGCQKIFNSLQKFIGLRQEMEGGLSWTILQRYDVGNDASLSDYPLKIECNSKLAVAYSVMDECFFPVVDPRSQSEMILNVIYNCGSNFRRLNYSGFYTFILEKGDEVVSAASIRFHGTKFAEMPFIGTRNIYRKQGLGRKLLTTIEKVLSSMDIQKLIIPAVSEVMAMWTDSFCFTPLTESTWQKMKTASLIVFPGTDMLQKPLAGSTESESEPSVPEVKPLAEGDLEKETCNDEAEDNSEQTREERCESPLL